MSSILKVDTIQNTGGTTGLTIDSSGRMLTPARPAFSAHLTNATNITSSNNTIVFNSVVHNQGSHYNSSNGIFTAPVTGLYYLSAGIGVFLNSATDSRFLVVYLQTGNTSYQDLLLTGRENAVNTSGSTYGGVNVAGVVPLNANTGVRVKAEMENSSSATVTDRSCYFTGYLIG
tara:strand:+ start:600 stop:1121 length:522 start_codon:yes stop_codon:yes gene_type:complete